MSRLDFDREFSMEKKFSWLRVGSLRLLTVRPFTRLREKSGAFTPRDRQLAVTIVTVNEDYRRSSCARLTDQIPDRGLGASARDDLAVEHDGCARRQGAAFFDNGSPLNAIRADHQSIGKQIPPEPVVADVEQ